MARVSLISFAFLLLLAMAFLIDISYAGAEGSLKPEECPKACDFRCSKKHHKKEACIETCNECCEKCLCVPSGTSGHKKECPCYKNEKPKKGHKCP